MLAGIDLVNLSSDEDAFSLRHALRLHDEVDLRALLLVAGLHRFQLCHLVGQEPGLGEELIVVGELLLHLLEVSSKVVLPGDVEHSWEVVYPLVCLDLWKPVEGRSHVGPLDVPVDAWGPRVALGDHSPPELLLRNVLDDAVLCVCKSLRLRFTESVEGYSRGLHYGFWHFGWRLQLILLFFPLLFGLRILTRLSWGLVLGVQRFLIILNIMV